MTKSVDYATHLNCIKDMQCKLKNLISILKISVALTLKVFYAPVVTIISVISSKMLTLVSLEETKRNFRLVVINCFGRKDLSTLQLLESGFYDIAVKILATMIIN